MKKMLIPLLLALTFPSWGQVADTSFLQPPEVENLLRQKRQGYALENQSAQVASKSDERLSEATASITVHDAESMESMGYYTLSDLASITAGYSVSENFGEKVYETRGVRASGFENDMHLVLIDGIPVNFARNYKAPADEELLLMFADRVEFLNGPASALYGTSAFNGVINIVSKDLGLDDFMAETKLSYSPTDQAKRVMGNVMGKNDQGIAKMSIGYFNKLASGARLDGYTSSTDGYHPEARYWDDKDALMFNSSYQLTQGTLKGTSVGVIYFQRTGGLGEYWRGDGLSSEIAEIKWKTFVPYLKYRKKLSARTSLNTYLKYNHSTEEGVLPTWASTSNFSSSIVPVATYQNQSANIELLGEIRHDLGKGYKLTAGYNFDWRRILSYPNGYEDFNASVDSSASGYQTNYAFGNSSYEGSDPLGTNSLFGQVQKEFDVLEGLIVTGGMRLDHGETPTAAYNQLSPRIALVQKLNTWLNVKAMFNQALLAPPLKGLSLNRKEKNDPVNAGRDAITGLPDLKAQTIQSIEGGLVVSRKWLYLSGMVYYNTVENVLARAVIQTRSVYINYPGSTNAFGFEFDVKVAHKGATAFANYATSDVINRPVNPVTRVTQPDEVPADVPLGKTNIGAGYTLQGKLPISAMVIWKSIGQFTLGGEKGKEASPREGFSFLDANLRLPVNESLSFELQARNILDEKAYYRFAGNDRAPMPGRQFIVTMGVKF